MNRITLMGRLANDPEYREAGEIKISNFSVAVDRVRRKDKEVETDFFPCAVFGNNADFAVKYLRKGQRVLVSGAVHIDYYTSKEGIKKLSVSVSGDTLEYADGKRPNATENEKNEIENPIDIPFK